MMYEIAGVPAMSSSKPTWSLTDLQEVIARHWGFRSLRPFQEQAMQAR